jgi:hypothetical protein
VGLAYDDAHRQAETYFARELWDGAEAALEALTPALWQMALASGAELDTVPDGRCPQPRRALRKAQPDGEVAIVIAIAPRAEGPAGLADLDCVVSRVWTFAPRWLHRQPPPASRTMATYSLPRVAAADPSLVTELEALVSAGLKTRQAPR